MRAGNADLRMSQTTVTHKTQGIVTLHHRITARSDAQVKPHNIGRNELGAAYAAVIVPHWYFLASAGDRSAIDDVIQGTCWLRWLAL